MPKYRSTIKYSYSASSNFFFNISGYAFLLDDDGRKLIPTVEARIMKNKLNYSK